MIRELDRESDVAAVEKPGFRFVVFDASPRSFHRLRNVEQIQPHARAEEEREPFAGVERKVQAGFEIEGKQLNLSVKTTIIIARVVVRVIDAAVADARGENQLRGNGAARGGKIVGVFEGQAAEVDLGVAIARVQLFVRSLKPERVKRLQCDRVRARRLFGGFGIVRVIVVSVSGVPGFGTSPRPAGVVVGGALRERSRGGNERESGGGAEEFADGVHDVFFFEFRDGA